MISLVKSNRKITNFLLLGLSIIFNLVGVWGIRNYLLIKKTDNLIPPEKICDHCNVLLIDVDILRADALPCYGYSRDTAPNICNFAKDSVVFKDNYSTSIWTLPSMFSTVTSLTPPFHRVRTGMDKMPQNISTLAENLKKQGYKTIFVGQDGTREMLINNYNNGLRGYDLVTNDTIEKVLADISTSKQPWFIHYYRGDLHLPYVIDDTSTPIENLTTPKDFPITKADFYRQLNKYLKKHRTEVFTQKALKDFSALFADTSIGSTALTTIFYDFTVDAKKRGEYLINIWEPVENCYLSFIDPKKSSDTAFVRMMYDSTIRQFDKSIGPLLQEFTLGKLSRNTITIVMSDHGETFGEHGTFSHDNNFHSELFYTPLIIRSPKFSPKQVDRTTSNIDIFPTILSLVGAKIPIGIQGRSLTPYFNGADFDSSILAYGEDFGGATVLQNRKWLYFLPTYLLGINSSELYNKTTDPSEKNNVYLKYPLVTQLLFNKASLFQSYDTTLKNTGETMPDFGGTKINPQKVEKLKKEGYF